jgi:transcriptional regulator with XRE-family HTH domain
MLFAKTLRKHREKRGLSREELAAEVHHSASTIANVETGYRAPTVEQARDFDEFFDTPGTFVDLEGRLHGLPFSAGFRPFKDVEAECVVLKLYEPLLVPGLLQTEDYMRAVFETHPGVTPELVDERTAGRLARQGVLARESPPRVWWSSRTRRTAACPVPSTWPRRNWGSGLRTLRRQRTVRPQRSQIRYWTRRRGSLL